MTQPARNGGMSSPVITLRYWMRHPGYGRVSSSSRPTTRRPIWSIAGNTHSKVHHAGERKLTADREFGEKHPTQAISQPVELAPAYVLLASDDGSYMLGAMRGNRRSAGRNRDPEGHQQRYRSA